MFQLIIIYDLYLLITFKVCVETENDKLFKLLL